MPPSRITTVRPPTVLRSTHTRDVGARRRRRGTGRARAGRAPRGRQVPRPAAPPPPPAWPPAPPGPIRARRRHRGCRGHRRRRPAAARTRRPPPGRVPPRPVASMWSASASASVTLEAPNACNPRGSSHGDARASAAATRRSPGSMPNLPAPSSPTRRTALEGSRAGDRGPQQHRLAAPQGPGDRGEPRAARPTDSTVTTRTPASTAARQLLVALAGAGEHDAPRSEPRMEDMPQLPTRRHVRTEAERRDVLQDGEAGVGLDRVGELERGRQDRSQRLDPAATPSRS